MVKERKGGQRKKGRSKEEREVKGRKGGQRKKGRPDETWKTQVEEESVKVGLSRKDSLANQSGMLTLIRLLLG